jgi:hypothetical protein
MRRENYYFDNNLVINKLFIKNFLFLDFFFLADVYSTLARTTSPTHQPHLVTNQARSNSPGSFIGDIIESPEQEKVWKSLFFSIYFIPLFF